MQSKSFRVIVTSMDKTATKQKMTCSRILLRITLSVIGLLLLNQLVYAIIVPLIFFNASYSEDDYRSLLAQSDPRELVIETENGSLYGWEFGNSCDAVLLYFGGDNVDSNAWLRSVLDTAGSKPFGNVTLLTVDYPTFGRSSGTVSEQYFYETAQILHDYARQHYPHASLYVMGYSMGTAAALSLADEDDITGLLLIAPMYDGTSLYLPRQSFLHTVFEPTATVQMQNDEFASVCAAPTLIVAGYDDTMTKAEDVFALAALFPQMPKVQMLEDCAHGAYWQRAETYSAITSFLYDIEKQINETGD